MYVAIDIGGTKTLVGVFDSSGNLIVKKRFPTDNDYKRFMATLLQTLHELNVEIVRIAIAAPGKINRKEGKVTAFGNLKWKNASLKDDIRKHFDVPILIENDANLAGLSEAQYIKNEYKKVLYLTISTGIGTGIITNGMIDTDFEDSEGGQMPLEHQGETKTWESFASGKAIQKKYGKLASQITDQKIWSTIAENIAKGLIDLIAVVQPDAIVFGGGAVATQFDLLHNPLKRALEKISNPLVTIPPLLLAKRPEEAVIYGCYELIKMSK